MSSFVSVGVTILDVVGHPINQIPENDGTDLVEKILMCPAGTAAAPAIVASRLGADSTLIGAVGSDEFGRFLLDRLRSEGVNTSLIQEREDMPTATTMLAINSAGGRPNWHMPGAFLMLEPTEEVRARIVSADYLHWGGVGMLFNMDGEVAANLLSEARKGGTTISADLIAPGPHTLDSIKAVAPCLDYFMPSIDEALEISGQATVEAAADFFFELGVNTCVIKCGGEGAYISNQNGVSEKIPVIRDVNVVDTSGCGDSFCGGFNVGLSKGFDLITSAHFASATAAQVASGFGSQGSLNDFETTLEIMNAGTMALHGTGG